MEWRGDLDAFVQACADATDLRAFAAALRTVPVERWAEVAARLRAALSEDGSNEPTHLQRQVGVPLVDRMRTPAAVLMRQIRLEKLRMLDEAKPS